MLCAIYICVVWFLPPHLNKSLRSTTKKSIFVHLHADWILDVIFRIAAHSFTTFCTPEETQRAEGAMERVGGRLGMRGVCVGLIQFYLR